MKDINCLVVVNYLCQRVQSKNNFRLINFLSVLQKKETTKSIISNKQELYHYKYNPVVDYERMQHEVGFVGDWTILILFQESFLHVSKEE